MRMGTRVFIGFKLRRGQLLKQSQILYLHTSQASNIPDYYGILGLPRNATQSEIKKSFLELSKKYHPDMNLGGSKQATETFLEVKEAYNQLFDPATRNAYNFKLDNLFSTPNFQAHVFDNSAQPEYPPPEEYPRVVKWLDSLFPTASVGQSRREINLKHFKVIVFMIGLCFLWYSIKNWQIRKHHSGITKMLERQSEKNKQFLQSVEERARNRPNIDHLMELKAKSENRAANNAVRNSEK